MSDFHIGHWHHKYTRTLAALAHGRGGSFWLGQGPDMPNGYRNPKAVLAQIAADCKAHLGADFEFESSIQVLKQGFHTIELKIEPSREKIWERFGLCWICLDQEIHKCTQGDLRALWNILSPNTTWTDTELSKWLADRHQDRTLLEEGIFQVLSTADGSTTLYRKDMDETYHSKHGSRRESAHVFISEGLRQFNVPELRILEIGLGTGLNCLLSASEDSRSNIYYHALEPIPIPEQVLPLVGASFGEDLAELFEKLHQGPWNQTFELKPNFRLYKDLCKLENYVPAAQSFHLIYFDAFAPNKQPEMWMVENFRKLYDSLQIGGMLVSYCSQSAFQKSLIEVGFELEILPGPPGKREMLRAHKKKDFS